jgi:site-specific DNA recombinase
MEKMSTSTLNESAKPAGREQFVKMVEHFRKNSFAKQSNEQRPILLVEKTGRLYRNTRDQVTIEDLRLEIHFSKKILFSPLTLIRQIKFMHGIKVLVAKNYIENLSEETKKGMIEKAKQGTSRKKSALRSVWLPEQDSNLRHGG